MYWKEKGDITSIDSLNKSLDIDIKAAEDETVKQKLHDATAWAHSKGAFGVPTFVCTRGSDDKEDYFFGGDRQALIESFLTAAKVSEDRKTNSVPSTKQNVKFYYDFSSPWSYLAFKQLESRLTDPGFCTITPVPILVGALFKSLSGLIVPIQSFSGNKQRYFKKDFGDYCNYHSIPVQWNKHFPFRTVQALRMAIIEPRVMEAFFDTAWLHNLDLGDEQVLIKLIQQHLPDIGTAELVAKSKTDELKQQLQVNNSEALQRGVFGVPMFEVEEQEGDLFFGQDRIAVLQDHLCAWR